MHIFITGTDTNVGKTVISSWLCLHTQYSYYKPIQTGCYAQDPDSDRARVHQYSTTHTYPEAWVHPMPAAPGVIEDAMQSTRLNVSEIPIPQASHLIIEGAGGVLVPLNSEELLADMIIRMNIPVILVSRPELGTINHTLLSIEALRARSIQILGVIMNRPCTPEVANAIQVHGNVPMLATFPELQDISYETLQRIPLTPALIKIFSRAVGYINRT